MSKIYNHTKVRDSSGSNYVAMECRSQLDQVRAKIDKLSKEENSLELKRIQSQLNQIIRA